MHREAPIAPLDILLVEPSTLLRRTVALTIRSLGLAAITEAATYPAGREVCARRPFQGAVVALDADTADGVCEGLSLVQRIRAGASASSPSIPVAVLVDACDAERLQVLRSCGVSRILIKPFRARDVIDTIDAMAKKAAAAA